MNFLEAYFLNPITKRLSEHIEYAVLLYVLFFLGIYFLSIVPREESLLEPILFFYSSFYF